MPGQDPRPVPHSPSNRPLFITGTGRSGTSAVARVAHERLGVDMGPNVDEPTRLHPYGTYEDSRFVRLHIQVNQGRIPFPEFRARATDLVESRSGRWGLKDPRMCYLIEFYRTLLPDAVWIVCWRDLDRCAESIWRATGGRLEDHRAEMERRAEAIQQGLVGHGVELLLMDDWRSDEWIEEKLVTAAPWLADRCEVAS